MKNRLNYRLRSILDIRRRFSSVVDPSKRKKLINQAMKKRNVQLSALSDLLEFGSRGLARLGRRQKALEKHGRNQGKKPWEKTDPVDMDDRIVRVQDPLSPMEVQKRRIRKAKEGSRRSKKKADRIKSTMNEAKLRRGAENKAIAGAFKREAIRVGVIGGAIAGGSAIHSKIKKNKKKELSALQHHIIEFGHSAHFRRALKSLKRKIDSKPYVDVYGIKMKSVIKENKERMRLKARLKQAEQSGSKRITKRILES